jgi:hypothetical protein
MKPTRRRNGTDMVTVQVRFHLTKTFVAKVVMDTVLNVDTEDPDQVTRTMVDNAVREKVWVEGTDWADWVMDNYDDDDLAVAMAVVSRLWPGWKGEREG